MAEEKKLDVRDMEELSSSIQHTKYTVFKSYLHDLKDMAVIMPDEDIMEVMKPEDCIRLLRLKKLTCQKNEDVMQKLTTVYNSVLSTGASLIVMIDSPDKESEHTDIYIGVRYYSYGKRNVTVDALHTLKNGIASHFPGTEIESITSNKNEKGNIQELLDSIFSGNISISAVSTVASIRDKSKTENKGFIQGIERLIDAMRGQSYTAIFIADPISNAQCEEIRSGMETLYSAIAPFAESVWTYNENESEAVMETLSKTAGTSVTNGTNWMQSHNVSNMRGSSDNVNIGINGGMNSSNTNSESISHMDSNGHSINGEIVGDVISILGGAVAAMVAGPVGAMVAKGIGSAIGSLSSNKGSADTIAETVSNSIGKALGINVGYGHSWNRAKIEGDTDSKGGTKSKTKQDSKTSTQGTTSTTGSGRMLQITNPNKTVQEILKRIDEQLKRIKESDDYGLFSCGAYFISNDVTASTIAANTYRALMIGESSSVESSAVNTWSFDAKDDKGNNVKDERVKVMKEYLKRLYQPVFAVGWDEDSYMPYSAGTLVSGLELPMHLALPMKSVIGMSVIEHAAFGRNVPVCDNVVELGRLYHMGEQIKSTNVQLDINSLTSHTFITGSTGSGKSNTIYKLLDELTKKDIKFLVIEPAKGEYKNIFGGRSDVCVYGTNPFKVPNLLKLNPFSFPDDVHVLEHIDRLVEIFNACWPMYAAMPAILKESIERAYEECGWNLKTSKNPGAFPTFSTVLEILPTVVDSSAYSADTSSDYKGALITRIRSLTRGIHGQIFNDDISSKEIFNRNVIVDLSRVGSQETKSLIMGILTLKLQEFRMSEDCMNSDLRHITVLEEAHNLLRRTSPEQSQESANLQGKSVEMIANSIAEMRTYGEGFIIADQSPGLMDMSVIRNTNTKIILRLPDESDRQLVGKSAGLNDMQIEEIARLETGVAAIHQNSWLEPVLCKIEKFEDEQPIKFSAGTIKWLEDENDVIRKFINTVYKEYKSSDSKSNNVFTSKEKEIIRKWYIELNVNDKVKHLFEYALNNQPISKDEKILLMRYIVGNKLTKFTDVDDINREIAKNLNGKYGINEETDTLRNISQLFMENFPKNIR